MIHVIENIIAACFKLRVENVDIVEGNAVNSYDERILSVINEPDSSLKSVTFVAMIHEMN